MGLSCTVNSGRRRGMPAAAPSTISGMVAYWRAEDLTGYADAANLTSWSPAVGSTSLVQITGNGNPVPKYYSAAPFAARPAACHDTNLSNPVLTNNFGGSVFNKQAYTFFWCGTVNDLEAQQCILNVGGLDFTLKVSKGMLLAGSGDVTASTSNAAKFWVPSNRNICVVVTMGTSAVKVYVDSATNVQSLTANSAGNSGFAGISISRNGADAFYGATRRLGTYSAELSSSDVAKIMTYCTATDNAGTSAATPTGHVLTVGDSVTHGNFSSRNQGWANLLNPASTWHLNNFGVGGKQLSAMVTDQADPFHYAVTGNWLILQGGYNDINIGGQTGTVAASSMIILHDNAVTAGFDVAKIIVLGLSTSSPFSGNRDTFNSILRAHSWGGSPFVDWALDPVLGCSGSAFTAAGNYLDAIHPNDTGHPKIAAMIRAAVPTLP
jgi:lysophospholipase L1-like esterase